MTVVGMTVARRNRGPAAMMRTRSTAGRGNRWGRLETAAPMGRRAGRPDEAPRSAERGSAGVWVLALSGVVLLAGAASVLAGVAMIGRHEAGTAADLSALAAASRALSGSEIACSSAEEIANANGADLQSCSLGPDGVVNVAVTVTVQFGSLGLGQARAQARAGPVQPPGEATADE